MSVRVKGLQDALNGIERKGEAIQKAVIEVLAQTASDIDFDAKTNAPYELIEGQPLGTKQKIAVTPINQFNYKVEIRGAQDFDAYAEFGTGQDAREILNSPGYTDKMRAMARQFLKNGRGTLIGQPFLIPSFLKNTANLVDELKKEIEVASKK